MFYFFVTLLLLKSFSERKRERERKTAREKTYFKWGKNINKVIEYFRTIQKN